MESWLDYRSVSDSKLFFDEFLFYDWIAVAGFGLLLGIVLARIFWYRSKRKFVKEQKKLRSELTESLRQSKETLPERFEALNAEEKALLDEQPKAKKSATGKKPKVVNAPVFVAGDKVVFAMDVSKTMTRAQIKFCKKALIKGVRDLLDLKLEEPPMYQVIFFSGPSWFAHQEMVSGGKNENDPVVIRDGDTEMRWNPVANKKSTFTYQGGIENLPKGEWRQATPDKIEETIKSIKNVGQSYGTTWHCPLMMAMNLDPAPERIDFLTDGQTANQRQVALGIVHMVETKGSGTIINTFGPVDASEPLRYIAEQTGGEYHEFASGGSSRPAKEDPDLLPGLDLSKG